MVHDKKEGIDFIERSHTPLTDAIQMPQYPFDEVPGNGPSSQSLILTSHRKKGMCDCMEFEYEDVALGTEEKEPVKVAAPLLVVKSKKK